MSPVQNARVQVQNVFIAPVDEDSAEYTFCLRQVAASTTNSVVLEQGQFGPESLMEMILDST